jgi:PKD repeat protein
MASPLRFLLMLLFGCSLVNAQLTPPPLQIGTNISSLSDWSAEWPFVDIMKQARKWIPHNMSHIPGGVNAWDTECLDEIPMDADGWPLELPYAVADMETLQVVRTVWANTQTMLPGIYTVLHDGEGLIDFGFDAHLVSREPGRLTFELIHNGNIASMELLESTPGNHLRNIRIITPGYEEGDTWNQVWLDKLEPFSAIRFMDWGRTNNSTLSQWSDRPQLDDYVWTLQGVPYEKWVELCNLLNKDAWVCVPHLADDSYITNLATLFQSSLNPELKVYLEYSNELWNWMFTQAQYCVDQGDQNIPWPERIAPFIQNTFEIWSGIYAGQEERLRRVVGVQAAWQDVSNRIVFAMPAGSVDAFSPAGYFGISSTGIAALEVLGESATAADVLYWGRESLNNDTMPWLRTQKEQIGDSLGIPMLYYEGGQHLTPTPFGSDQPYNQALVDAQSNPGMLDLYHDWLDSLRALSSLNGEDLLMNFSFVAPESGRYGSWGTLTNQYALAPYAEEHPKYQALLEHIALSAYTGPAADFSANPQTGAMPLYVSFQDLSIAGDAPLTHWFWDFGDGNTSQDPSPQHIYESAGLYTVSLIVRDANTLTDQRVLSQSILVTGVSAGFSLDHNEGFRPLEVQFADLSASYEAEITGWQWDFGDGHSSALQHPVHSYQDAGHYFPSLTVYGSDGSSSTYQAAEPIRVLSSLLVDESFNQGLAGEALPAPWSCLVNGSYQMGAVQAGHGLGWGYEHDAGGAASFTQETEDAHLDGALGLVIGPGNEEQVDVYISYLLRPHVDPAGGWGEQAICVGLSMSEGDYLYGVWFGITQDCNTSSPNYGREFWTLCLSGRSDYDYGANETWSPPELPEPANDESLWVLCRYTFYNHATAADSLRGRIKLVHAGEPIPLSEPVNWDMDITADIIWPLGDPGRVLDRLYIHRDNTSNNMIVDELRVGRSFAAALPRVPMLDVSHNGGTTTLNWTPCLDANEYVVETFLESAWQELTRTTATALVLQQDTVGQFRVRAVYAE